MIFRETLEQPMEAGGAEDQESHQAIVIGPCLRNTGRRRTIERLPSHPRRNPRAGHIECRLLADNFDVYTLITLIPSDSWHAHPNIVLMAGFAPPFAAIPLRWHIAATVRCL